MRALRPQIPSFIRRHAIGALALCVALGGTAYAAAPKIGSKSIKPGAISTNKLKKAAVTEAKLRNGAVSTAKIKDGAVTGLKLADGSVSSANVQDASIIAADLAPGALAPGTTIQGGFSKNVPEGSSVAYPVGQTETPQGSAVAPVNMTVGNLHVVASGAPGVGEPLTLTLFTAPPGNSSAAGPTPVTCTIIGPGESCSTDATASVDAGGIYTFIVNRGPTPNGVNFGYTMTPR